MEILLDESRGLFIPRDFAQVYNMPAWHVSEEDAGILLAGPSHDLYWEVWDAVLGTAYFVDGRGAIWRLFQDGSLFAVQDGEELDW